MRVSIVGGGVMAEAIVRGVLATGVASQILVSEPIAERRAMFGSLGANVSTTKQNSEVLMDANLVLLCVKPQLLDHVAEQLRGKIKENQTIVSVLAGVTTAKIGERLNHWNVVRVMPNISASIGRSMSVWFATHYVGKTNSEFVKTVLEALGEEIRVPNEALLDAATAINGSGPAYVFLFIEAIQDAGIELGFSLSEAKLLATQTVLGSAALARQSNVHVAELKNRVTSPGGTTAAGLRALEEAGFRAAVTKGIREALKRSSELGGGK